MKKTDRRFHLLLGAGFSRNWGGWLANEVTDYLLGTKTLSTRTRDLLFRQRRTGGFELVYGTLLAEYENSRDQGALQEIRELQAAIKAMFDEMNREFEQGDLFMINNMDRRCNVRTLLEKFDCIFTLNQDLLLELQYVGKSIQIQTASGRTLGSAYVPFIKPKNLAPQSTRQRAWLPDEQSRPSTNVQPIIKLHGSTNWERDDGSQLMVLGSRKHSQIASNSILTAAFQCFESELAHPNTNLMVIGYGFGDDHINKVIEDACKHSGLRVFIVDPLGLDVVDRTNSHAAIPIPDSSLVSSIQRNFAGASRRSLHATFSTVGAEYNKLMRFFA